MIFPPFSKFRNKFMKVLSKELSFDFVSVDLEENWDEFWRSKISPKSKGIKPWFFMFIPSFSNFGKKLIILKFNRKN